MQFFFIHLKGSLVAIHVKDICYVQALAHHVKIVTDNGTFIPHVCLKQLEEKLPSGLFTRVNRGTLVSLSRVVSFNRDEIILKNGRFSFTDKYRKEFREKVTVLMNEDTKQAVK